MSVTAWIAYVDDRACHYFKELRYGAQSLTDFNFSYLWAVLNIAKRWIRRGVTFRPCGRTQRCNKTIGVLWACQDSVNRAYKLLWAEVRQDGNGRQANTHIVNVCDFNQPSRYTLLDSPMPRVFHQVPIFYQMFAELAVRKMNENDWLSIVTFASEAVMDMPMQRMLPGNKVRPFTLD